MKMDKIPQAVAMILLASALATAQSAKPASAATPARAEAEIRALLGEFLEGASRNDAAVHDRFWAEELIYTGSSGVRRGKAELMKGVRGAPAPKPDDPKTTYSAEGVKVHLYGDAAVLAFRLVVRTEKDGKTDTQYFLNTGTLVKRDGRWQVVAWQATKQAESTSK
jgi:uncharacterized protein (TIGR02246 family)